MMKVRRCCAARAAAWPFAAGLILLLAAAPAPGAPTDEQVAPLGDAIDKEIRVQFLETPLNRVIETLQRESGLTFLLDRAEMRALTETPVTLESPSMSIREVLDLVTSVTATDWEVRDGVIMVSSRNAIARRNAQTHVYDVRGLLVYVPNFIAPSLDVNGSLSNTNSGGSDNTMGAGAEGVAQASTSLFGAEPAEQAQLSRQERIERIVTLIQDTVGRQNDWTAYGGELNSIRELNGNLIVRGAPHVHEQVRKLLEQLHDTASLFVVIEGRYISVKTAVLDPVIAANDGSLLLSPQETDRLLNHLSGDDAGAKTLAMGRTICFNGQRVNLVAVNESTFLSDVEPIPGTSGIDPTLSTVRQGAVLDVEPTINYRRDGVVMTFRGDVVTGGSINTSTIPTGGEDRGITLTASGRVDGEVTQPKPAIENAPQPPGQVDGRVRQEGMLLAPQKASRGTVELEKPSQDLVRYRSSIEIPDGGSVLYTSASGMMKSVEQADTEVVLLIRARIVKRDAAKPAEE